MAKEAYTLKIYLNKASAIALHAIVHCYFIMVKINPFHVIIPQIYTYYTELVEFYLKKLVFTQGLHNEKLTDDHPTRVCYHLV